MNFHSARCRRGDDGCYFLLVLLREWQSMCYHSRFHSNRIHGQVLVFWLLRWNEDRKEGKERPCRDEEPKWWSDARFRRLKIEQMSANDFLFWQTSAGVACVRAELLACVSWFRTVSLMITVFLSRRAQSRSQLSAAVCTRWILHPRASLPHPDRSIPRCLRATPPPDSCPMLTNSAKSSANLWKRSAPMSKSVPVCVCDLNNLK